jgi:putative endonuclease
MYTVYILYSESLSKYYVGHTSMGVEERLERHLCDHGGYISKAKDWKVVYTEGFETKTEAIKKESSIKKHGIKRYLGG